MRLLRLQVENLRVIRSAAVAFGPGLNLLSGPNGSGKTSLLEAIHLLAAGRSFRAGPIDGLIRQGASFARSVAQVEDPVLHRTRQLGIERRDRVFTARVDGETVERLTELFALCPVVCFQPDSGSLLSGPSEERRRFVDWALFHVEPGFLDGWRRYQRALKQRNALLREPASGFDLAGWDAQLVAAAEPIDRWRRDYISALQPRLAGVLALLLPELGSATLRYRPGWAHEYAGLAEALEAHQDTDRRLGFTSVGPHRAGWVLGFEAVARHDQLSRGQGKLAALAALLAQAGNFLARRGQAPIVCLDDVTAELDPQHQGAALDLLGSLQMQTILTSAEPTPALRQRRPDTWFHVEHGVFSQRV